jgi:flagellar motor switch protein FliN
MEESILSYFEQWIQEFAQAVEMFSGERPTLAQKPAEKSQTSEWEAKRGEIQWWQQSTEQPNAFTCWIGVEDACLTALGGTGDGGDPKELFQEMLGQANSGTAAVLSSSFPSPIRFAGGSFNAPESLSELRLAEVSVTFREAVLPPIVIALQASAAKILDGPDSGPVTELGQPQPQANALSLAPRPHSPMLDRLMDLHLPVSVLLGQTVLPIRDVLKIASGSLIELDRQLGDYVEVMVHGTVVARGEIVAIKGNYGVRIKEVISRKDRFALKDAA